MAGAPIQVLHAAVPGRARLHVAAVRQRPRAAERLRLHLLSQGGIREARVSAVTGNLLVQFDPARQDVRRLGSHVREFLDRSAPADGLPPGTAVAAAIPALRGDDEEKTARDLYRRAAAAPVEQLLREAAVPDLNGLTEEEARRRAADQGDRTLERVVRRSPAEILRGQVVSVPNALLAGAMGLSLFTGARLDVPVIGAVLLLNGVIGYLTEQYAERAVEALQRLGYPRARVVRAGKHQRLPAASLVRGDVIRLRSGDLVPADARLVEGTLLVNEAMLTGESEAVAKHAEPTPPPEQIYEFRNVIFQGTAVVDGRARALVLATGRDTELGRIQWLVKSASPPRTALQEELDRLGVILGAGAASISAALFGFGALRGQRLLETLQTATSLAVSAVPEGLPTIATTALAVGMRRMLRREVIIRRLAAVESLGSLTVLCVDKTGTLTLNRMTASRFWWEGRIFQHRSPEEAGVGGFWCDGAPVRPRSHPALDAMLRVGVLCNEAKLRRGKSGMEVSGSATEGALLLAGCAAGYWFEDLREEYPTVAMHRRDERHMRMATIHHRPGGGALVAVKGSPDAVLRSCRFRMDAGGQPVPVTREDRARYAAANHRMAEDGLRVLAFAMREDNREPADEGPLGDLTWLGLVGLEDPIRPGVADAIRRCRHAGVRTVILTGDQRGTAVAVARELGLDEGPGCVVEAPALERISPEELGRTAAGTAVYARVTPEHKLRIVQALQARGEVVAMTGDGINDGPALRAADVGVAMGKGSSDVAKEIADVVLRRNEFDALVDAVEQGRVIYANIHRALRFLLSTNVAELLLAGASLLTGFPFPFRPIQLLWLNLVSDVFPALALVLEPVDRDVMRQPPRTPGAPLLGRRDWRLLTADAGLIAAVTAAAYLRTARRVGYGPTAGAVALTTITVSESLYALACSGRRGMWGRGVNAALLGTVGGTIGLQVAANHWGPMRRLLHGAPPSPGDYGFALLAATLPPVWAAVRGHLASLSRGRAAHSESVRSSIAVTSSG